jgi:hypothetical protein
VTAPPYWPQPPRKPVTSQAWFWLVVGVGIVAFVIGAVAVAKHARDTTPTDAPATTAAGHVVVYQVDGTAGTADVTYLTRGGEEQQNGTLLPFAKHMTDSEAGSLLSLVAQSKSPDGSVTCRIVVDGRVISEHTSSGGYAVVSCDGTGR